MHEKEPLIPPSIAAFISEELLINQEISELKVSLEEKKRLLSEYRKSRTLGDKMGITRVPFRRSGEETLLANIEELQQQLGQALERWQHKRFEIDRELAGFFHRHNLEYQQVEAGASIYGDIRKLVAALKEHLHSYCKLLIDIQANILVGYDHTRDQYSAHVRDMMRHAAQSGYQSDALLDQLNDADQKYHSMIHGTFLKRNSFPTVHPLNLGDFSSGIKLLPLQDAGARIKHMIAILKHFEDHSLAQYTLELEQSEKRHTLAREKFILRAWEISRQAIWKSMYHQERILMQMPRMATAVEA